MLRSNQLRVCGDQREVSKTLGVRMVVQNHYDAIVIGSGHNGLIAAAYLAKAGQSVLVLEKNNYFGGATASQRVFPDYDAMLSRYSYLVSLLPKQIVQDLDLRFETRRRTTASFTPWTDSNGQQRGLVFSNVNESRSKESLLEMTGSHESWTRYREFLELQTTIAKVIWPTMLSPLRSRQEFVRNLSTEQQRQAWSRFIERPLGESIEEFADHDALRGLLMTDGKIGVFTHPHDASLLQNRCFLYHIIGNETGEWRVPVGGMKQLVTSLVGRCRELGVDMLRDAPAIHVDAGLVTKSNATRSEVTFLQDGSERTASAEHILVNAAPNTFRTLLGQDYTPSKSDEGSVIKVNMLLKRLPKLKASNISSEEGFAGSFHIDEGYEQMLESHAAAKAGEVPDPAPGEVYCHTLTDDSILSEDLRKRGFHTLTLFGLDMPWRLFESDHDERKEKVTELYLEGLNRLTDEPFEDCLATDHDGQLCIETKTPQDLKREVDLDQG
ncbi:MAG: NAD(P)/FAD-dependent oxidoreductase, partial [Planctomycetota bacterium]